MTIVIPVLVVVDVDGLGNLACSLFVGGQAYSGMGLQVCVTGMGRVPEND